MFCSIVPWFLLGIGFGKCSERRNVLGTAAADEEDNYKVKEPETSSVSGFNLRS